MKIICPRCGETIAHTYGFDPQQPDLEDDLIEAHECPAE